MGAIVILGAGTGGTIAANRLLHRLGRTGVEIMVAGQVAGADRHVYQLGLLFVPFGLADLDEITRPRARQLHAGIRFVQSPIDRVDIEGRSVFLANGRVLRYDVLIVATGAVLVPEDG